MRHVGGDELCESMHFSSGPVLLIGHQINYDTPLNLNSINSTVDPLYGHPHISRKISSVPSQFFVHSPFPALPVDLIGQHY